MYYVYEYVDPRNMLPFYIGKGKGDRKTYHLLESELSTANLKKYRKIKKIRSLGLEPIINILVDGIQDEESAYQIEEEYIQKYGRQGFEENGILTNICLGARPPVCKGERNGMFNKNHTEKSKAKMSEARKGKAAWNVGIPRDDSVKEAISVANTGKTPWNKGITRSDSDREKMREGWKKKLAEGYNHPARGVPLKKDTQCEHCGQFVSKSHYGRHHGNRCKKLKE